MLAATRRSGKEDDVAIAMRLTFPDTLPNEPNNNAHALAVEDADEDWSPESWKYEQTNEAAEDDDKEIAALIADADMDVLEEKDATEILVNWKS